MFMHFRCASTNCFDIPEAYWKLLQTVARFLRGILSSCQPRPTDFVRGHGVEVELGGWRLIPSGFLYKSRLLLVHKMLRFFMFPRLLGAAIGRSTFLIDYLFRYMNGPS